MKKGGSSLSGVGRCGVPGHNVKNMTDSVLVQVLKIKHNLFCHTMC